MCILNKADELLDVTVIDYNIHIWDKHNKNKNTIKQIILKYPRVWVYVNLKSSEW